MSGKDMDPPKKNVDLREGAHKTHPRTPVNPDNSRKGNPAREMVERLAAKTASELLMVAEKYKDVQAIHFHWLVYTRLLEMHDQAVADGDIEMQLRVLKEARMTSEQMSAHQVGMSRAEALNTRNKQMDFLRQLKQSDGQEPIDAEYTIEHELAALPEGDNGSDSAT